MLTMNRRYLTGTRGNKTTIQLIYISKFLDVQNSMDIENTD